MQFQKALEGTSFDKSTLNPIYKEMLRSIDLEIYTAENLHYLVNALVSNSKIPSELAMNRSEGRNLKKIAIQKPQELAKGAQRRVVIQAKAASIFHLPHRYGRKVKTRRDRNRRDGKFIPRQFNRAPVSFGPPTMGVPTPQFFPYGINSLFPSGMVIGQLPVFPSGMYYPPPLPSMATGQLPVFPPAMYTLPSMVTGQLPVFPPAMYPPPPFLGRPNPSPIAISGIRQLSIGMPSSVLPLTPINQETSSVEAQQKNSNIQAQVLNTSNQVKNPSLSLPKGFCITQLLDPRILVARALSKEQIEKQKIQEERKAKLPKQIVRKIKRRVNFKKRNITFQTRSPEWNIIKEHKAQISELIEQKKEQLIKEQNQTVSSKKYGFTPLYFQKKKANQKRRRQQKHNLIKQNRKALLQIFGIAIFNSGWPVSRKQIKEALGLEQKAEIAHEQLGQFMQMAEYKEVEQKLTQLPLSEIPHENQYKEVEQKLTQLLFSEIPHENQYKEVEQKLAQLPLSEVPHESQYNEQQW